MARFAFLLLLVAAGALVIALFFDHRGRRDARAERLRHAFLHGTPLQGHARPASLAEVVHPGGLRFRVPASWTIALVEEGRAAPAEARDDARYVEVEVVRLGGPASPTDALKAIPAEGDRTVETLPNGCVLMKSLAVDPGARGPLATYTWRLGRAVPEGGLLLAAIRLRLPVETATEVIGQADLGTLDREVREATFGERPSAPSAG